LTDSLIDLLPGDTRSLTWNHYGWLDGYLSDLPASPDSMAHSAAYFLHTGRKGLYLVRSRNQSALVAVHPNIENAALVLPTGGCAAPELWRELCDCIASNGWNVSLGRVPETLTPYVEPIGAFELTTEQKLDWRYPVTIVDTKKLSKLDGGEYSEYRRKVRRATKRAKISVIDQRSTLYAEFGQAVLEMIEEWAKAVSQIKKFDTEHLISSNLSAYELGLRRIEQTVCRIYFTDDAVIGFCASELPRLGRTANGIAMCLDRSWIGCSEFMYWTEAKKFHEQGYSLYNINGSETKSLDEFRSKLQPVNQISLHTYQLGIRSQT
jgi:hypothetical protein